MAKVEVIIKIDSVEHELVKDRVDDCTKCSIYAQCRSNKNCSVNLCSQLSGLEGYHFRIKNKK